MDQTLDQELEQFLTEVPSVIWELEARGEDWVYTRRYGELRTVQHQNLVGKSLFDLYPPGHPTLEAMDNGIRTKQYFAYIDSTTPGRFCQTRCKPIQDETGQVVRLVGTSIDITEIVASHLTVLDESAKALEMAQSEIYETVQSLANEPDFYQHFYLVYQPIVSLKAAHDSPNAIEGVEALIRLRVGERTIPPSKFLPCLESLGQSSALTRWVFNQACQDMAPILDKRPDFFVSVNIGIWEVLDPVNQAEIGALLQANPNFADSLHLEILETFHAGTRAEKDAMAEVFYQLRQLGVKLAIDDFGIQGSNFDRLSLLTAGDFLKIDRMFMPQEVYGVESSICLSMSWVGKAFQFHLIAEGVETIEQVTFMKNIGCDYAQGYYFYKPMELADLTKVLNL